MIQVLESESVKCSSGLIHKFDLIREIGGYGFKLNDEKLDWTFTVHGYYQAKSHFDIIINDVNAIDHIIEWVKS